MTTTTIDLGSISQLPDQARVRVFGIPGGVPEERRAALLGVLRALLGQWQENGVVTGGAAELLLGGTVLVLGYAPVGDDVSGCTKDGLTKTLLSFEEQLGAPIVNSPRLWTVEGGRVAFHSQPEFRGAAREGAVTGETLVVDHLVDRAGPLKAGALVVRAGDSWYARLLPPTG